MSAPSPAHGPFRPPAGDGEDDLLRRVGDQLEVQTALLRRISEQLDVLVRVAAPGPVPAAPRGSVPGAPGGPGGRRRVEPPAPRAEPTHPSPETSRPLSVLPPPSPVDPEHPVRGVPRPAAGSSRARPGGPPLPPVPPRGHPPQRVPPTGAGR